MERVQSLINKLVTQSQSQAPADELLKTTESLYAELRRYSSSETMTVRESVAVWLPSGYNTSKSVILPSEAAPLRAARPTETATIVEEKTAGEKAFVETQAEEKNSAIVVEKPAPAPQVHGVPMPPPQVKLTEPTHEQVEKPAAAYKQPSQFFNLRITDNEEEFVDEKVIEKKPEPVEVKTPQPVAPPKPDPVQAKPFPQYPDAASLMKNIFPLAPDPTPPAKELNQLVVDPAAIALNEKLMEKKVELGEVLAAGPKITDLRKAITINDKYQMINSLFRSDEDMFERSIRTLNNFGSLPEAHFWMQRELVVKLGWNEKDEMVQHFYKLVSRRFS